MGTDDAKGAGSNLILSVGPDGTSPMWMDSSLSTSKEV